MPESVPRLLQAPLALRAFAAKGRANVGYWVAARHRGQGVASRALGMISTWGPGLPSVHRLELYVEPWNEASWRSAEHAGYQREGLLRSWQVVGDERRDMYMYSLLRARHRQQPQETGVDDGDSIGDAAPAA